ALAHPAVRSVDHDPGLHRGARVRRVACAGPGRAHAAPRPPECVAVGADARGPGMSAPVRILELRSVRGTGGGPEKTILLGAANADPDRWRVTVCYVRDI